MSKLPIDDGGETGPAVLDHDSLRIMTDIVGQSIDAGTGRASSNETRWLLLLARRRGAEARRAIRC